MDALERVTELFRWFPHPWVVGGGHAIDLFLGKTTREHEDVDLVVYRQDQLGIQSYVPRYQIYVAHDDKLTLWEKGERLELPLHGLWLWGPGTKAGTLDNSPELEILLEERDDTHWIYRRDPRITLPLEQAVLRTDKDVPHIAPEIALLYKSRGTRDKDKSDFEQVLPELSKEQANWLRDALLVCNPKHEWLDKLDMRRRSG